MTTEPVITQPAEPTTEPQPTEPAATEPAAPASPEAVEPQPAATVTWKNGLSADLQNSPLVQKFDDSGDGLSKFTESHLNLERLLGHEKVPIPKDENDVEGWDRFKKALNIPSDASGYKLDDVVMPESAKDASFNKDQFAEVMAQTNATPAQARDMWKAYTDMTIAEYNRQVESYQGKINESINALRQEWGDAYDANVELGQSVINQFSTDKETNDFLTATLTQDPRAVKFLQTIGKQFAENSIGDFNVKRYSMSPQEARDEYEKVMADPAHPYLNEKAPHAEHVKAQDYVNRLISTMSKVTG